MGENIGVSSFDFGTQRLLTGGTPTVIKSKRLRSLLTSITSSKAATTRTRLQSTLPAGKKVRSIKQKNAGDTLWLPNTTRPVWLDGSLPGDRGFDPLGLAKPLEFLQFELDELDQNNAVNKAGTPIGFYNSTSDSLSSQSLQPYSEVFGLQRFRECELIHGRWAMLATLGVLVAESATGVSWVDAGKVELDGAHYLNFDLPFSLTQICWFEALAVGGAELSRNAELSAEKRIYPGGAFDPLGLATPGKASNDQINRLREAEIKHGRLAMVSFFGFGVQALFTGDGALDSLAQFASTL